jgi:hypothetical protein
MYVHLNKRTESLSRRRLSFIIITTVKIMPIELSALSISTPSSTPSSSPLLVEYTG